MKHTKTTLTVKIGRERKVPLFETSLSPVIVTCVTVLVTLISTMRAMIVSRMRGLTKTFFGFVILGANADTSVTTEWALRMAYPCMIP